MASISPSLPAPGLPGIRERGLSIDYKWLVLLCTVVGTFMTLLDSTIVNIALPKISSVFSVPVSSAQLVVTSYMLALAAIIPATGYLSDTFGTKRLYLITMALFTGGSALCALAWDNNSLVAFRVIQGLGGGMMGPLGMTMIFRSVPISQRNSIMGIYGLPLILAPVLGPTVGGYLVEYADWRSIFTLNIPIGVIGIFLGQALLRESERIPGLRFDWRGFILSAAGFSALLLGLSDGSADGWTSTPTLLKLGIGSVCVAGWIWVELTDPEPLLDLSLFRSMTFTLGMVVNFILTAGMFGGQLLLPIFLQSFRGLGAAEAGMITMAQALAMLPMMPIVGKLVDRFGARPLMVIGLPLAALTTWQFATLDITTSDNTIRWMLAARGAAFALVMMPAMTSLMNTVPMRLMSRASSLTNVSRQVFGSFGVAVFVTILQSRITHHTAVLSQSATSDNLPILQLLSAAQSYIVQQGGTAAQGQLVGMMAVYQKLQLTGAIMAFDDVFRIAAVVTLFALIPAMFFTVPKVKKVPGHGAAAMME